MRYPRRCLLPSTNTRIAFDTEGICGACRADNKKSLAVNSIDWDERSRASDALVEQARDRRAPLYDVLVPVSGGKDSISPVQHLLGQRNNENEWFIPGHLQEPHREQATA